MLQPRGSQGQERVSSLKVRHGSLEGSRTHRNTLYYRWVMMEHSLKVGSRNYRWTRGVKVSKVPGPTEEPFARGGCDSLEGSRMRSSLVRMRSSLVVRASDCQCTSCNGPGFDPSIRRHSGI